MPAHIPENFTLTNRSIEPPLGLIALLAIAIGGMIGGGIFSVLGLAVSIAGNGTALAFLVGSVIAVFAGYSYIKLALAFRDDGASFTYLERAFPRRPTIGALAGWTVVLGYVGTLALYAYTFGAYGANLLGSPGSTVHRTWLSISVLVVFMLINLVGARTSGVFEIVIVLIKVSLLVVLAVAGFFSFDPEKITPVIDQGVSSIFIAGALVFVAFEGFQLVTNAVTESRNPTRSIPLSIYGSIAVVTVIYVAITVVALGTLGQVKLVQFEEYALAEAAKPVLGVFGGVLVGVAALFSTSSAINGTVFGASRMLAEMAQQKAAPRALSIRNRAHAPGPAIVLLTLLAVVFTSFNQLELVAAFSSATFLLICIAVGIANFKQYATTKSNRVIVSVGIALPSVAIGFLIEHLMTNDISSLIKIASIYLAIVVIELLFSQRGRFPILSHVDPN